MTHFHTVVVPLSNPGALLILRDLITTMTSVTSTGWQTSSCSLGHNLSNAKSFFTITSFNNCWPWDNSWPYPSPWPQCPSFVKTLVTTLSSQSLICDSNPFFFSTLLAKFQNWFSISVFHDLNVLVLSCLISSSFFLISSLCSSLLTAYGICFSVCIDQDLLQFLTLFIQSKAPPDTLF